MIRRLYGGPQHAAAMGAQNHPVGFQFVQIPANRKGGYSEFLGKFFNTQLRLQRVQLRKHLLLTLFGFHSPPNRDFHELIDQRLYVQMGFRVRFLHEQMICSPSPGQDFLDTRCEWMLRKGMTVIFKMNVSFVRL